ncbi:hypothetical protein [Nostoc sp. FACHB-892]|uniref:hypothetical protein n=1 Tax=Nostoc sp. FACHB-892 TaxID=2692843 RepID=UPI001687CD71|nr:hypothetical protein [Nostoc sp. FACHB-892]
MAYLADCRYERHKLLRQYCSYSCDRAYQEKNIFVEYETTQTITCPCSRASILNSCTPLRRLPYSTLLIQPRKAIRPILSPSRLIPIFQ